MKRRGLAIAGLLLIAALAYGATGWYVVAPGEVAVVRRLGRVLAVPRGPGAHLGLPWGFDRVDRVRPNEVRRLSVGVAGVATVGDAPGAGEYLTGDLNLVRVRAVVQYRVADPKAFVLRSKSVDPILTRLTEASLSRALSRQAIDATLREGRAEVAREAERDLTRAADRYGLGVSILGVSLTDARPPVEVAPDFAAAQAARSDHDRRLTEAATRAATVLSTAESQANARIEAAHAASDRTLALSRARADRFLALLAEARKSRRLTTLRLYYDTLRVVLPRLRRKVLAPDETLDLSILGAPGR
jgi:membrane protease subunit HflK